MWDTGFKALKKLNSTLSIDVYGECGSFELPKPEKQSNYLESYEKIAKNYKFYLSFENSLCYEYITEKFFNAMASGMIPIVYGGIGQADYKTIAPPHSYIHVDDFTNPNDLINTLKTISQNDTLYQSYFWWKSDYELIEKDDLKEKTKCLLCQILNNSSFKSYNDYAHFTEYWNKCRP